MRLRVDLRDQPVDELDAAVAEFPETVMFLITAWQWSSWNPANQFKLSSRMMVMVPDFLYYARLVSTGQANEIARLPGSVKNLILSGLACVPMGFKELPRLARGEFWAGAEALLTYDLGLLNQRFQGDVVLHFNLADFAWLFENQRFINLYKKKAQRRPAWGIATQQISKALSCCARWNAIPDRLIYTPGYSRPESLLIETAISHQFHSTSWILDLTQWPKELITGVEIHDMQREYDNEWLLSFTTAIDVNNQA